MSQPDWIEDALAEGLTRDLPDWQRHYHMDAAFHAQVQVMRNLLRLVDQAMARENLSDDVRARVIRGALIGESRPDPAIQLNFSEAMDPGKVAQFVREYARRLPR